ncbi:MAG TPA: hypothetical protein VNE61_07520 [Ktedonobacteraceae bacterium]|nr:hypothetical protein [Ktedonobacteraceae bacterium]
MRNDLTQQGWTRRFTAIGRRLNEAAELYNQLGFEVCLEPVNPDENEIADRESCKGCVVTTLARTIYTRPSNGNNPHLVELPQSKGAIL